MTSAWSQLEQMLTCAICLDKFKNPRLLPCQHSFCGDACMEGLVDYARRQIKCPECRAEHRIPYQGISSLPSNVTLIRFLELHSRITGEEPEPVPTFLEKCSVCGEKVEGVLRCWHCEKKVCPDCKEAHLDLLRREIARVNGQTKRCLSRLQEFRDSLARAAERLESNARSIKSEIEGSTRRLLEDVHAKQQKLCQQVDEFAERELRTIERLKVASAEELETIEGNLRLAEEKLSNKQLAWTDQELSELREIYTEAMEFMRLFEPDLGDFSRKIRFSLVPEFETLRRRLCELGELKFSESIVSLMASSLSYCNATGPLALELSQQQQQQQQVGADGSNCALSLSQSGSSSNVLQTNGGGLSLLELPGSSGRMANSLMRSQSDHRLASQFQQRLKREQQQQSQQQQQQQRDHQLLGSAGADKSVSSRYASGRDYETESLRSRYAPPRISSAAQDSLLTRDWPRPSDSASAASGAPDFGSSIHFKSAFMRRKEKERQQAYGSGGASGLYTDGDLDDDLASEASSSYLGARNVRFHEPSGGGSSSLGASLAGQQVVSTRLFDVSPAERAPLSGIPRLEQLPYLLARLHELGARAIVDKKNTEEEGRKEKDLLESARQSLSRASERRAQRQVSEDEIEKQKQANQQAAPSVVAQNAITNNNNNNNNNTFASAGSTAVRGDQLNSSAPSSQVSLSVAGAAASDPTPGTASAVPDAPSSPGASASSARRSLYGAAVTEKSRRQLSSAAQDGGVASYSRRRAAAAAAAAAGDSQEPEASSASAGRLSDVPASQQEQQADSCSNLSQSSSSLLANAGSSSSSRPRRALRSSTRSISRQSSGDQTPATPPGGESSPAARRAKRLVSRSDSARLASQSEAASSLGAAKQPKNSTGSGDNNSDLLQSSSAPQRAASREDTSVRPASSRSWKEEAEATSRPAAGQSSSATTDEDGGDENQTTIAARQVEDASVMKAELESLADPRIPLRLGAGSPPASAHRRHSRGMPSSDSNTSENNSNSSSEAADEHADESSEALFGPRNQANRRSREMLPNAVNKLLDRSAQIRRDSQEQRTRAASPQRQQSGSTAARGDYGGEATSGQSSFYSSARSGLVGGRKSATGSGGYLRYQMSRSDSQQESADKECTNNKETTTTNSSNSIYTTASSSATRRSSPDSETQRAGPTPPELSERPAGSRRRLSGNSSDRTLTSALDSAHRSAYLGRRDSSTDTSQPPERQPYQSRFLSRSRTSAALSSGAGAGAGSAARAAQDEEPAEHTHLSPSLSSGRSYLSSRDRFMQSAALMSGSSAASSAASASGPAHHGYSRGGSSSSSSAVASGYLTRSVAVQKYQGKGGRCSSNGKNLHLGQNRHQPSSKAYFNNASPFLIECGSDEDDVDDDADSSLRFDYFSGVKSHSEYLRNKFSRTHNSSSSMSTSLSRSRSFHESAFAGSSSSRNADSHEDPDDEDDDADELDDAEKLAASRDSSASTSRTATYLTQRVLASSSRRSSLASQVLGLASASSLDSQNSAQSSTPRGSIYSGKRRMIFKLGSRGPDAGSFTWPRGVAVGGGARGTGEIVVADSSNHRVQIFDLDGRFLNEFGSYGSAPGEFDCLAGVAINRLHKLYVVSDRYNHRIQIFDMTGKFVRAFGELGREPGKFNLPWGVACDASGLIYVCDKENHRIQVFDVDGTELSRFGVCGSEPGQLQHPHYIALGPSKLVVTDTNNHRVQVFDLSGRMINTFGREGSLPGQFKFPRGIAMDDLGNVIVGDSGNNRLQIFSPDGSFIKSIGTWGSADGEFKGIEGVAVDSRYNILVCDRENHRIQVF